MFTFGGGLTIHKWTNDSDVAWSMSWEKRFKSTNVLLKSGIGVNSICWAALCGQFVRQFLNTPGADGQPIARELLLKT